MNEQQITERQNTAIEAAADALLAVCALQTGTDPLNAMNRATLALLDVLDRAEREHHGGA
jgi:hypothetical protein